MTIVDRRPDAVISTAVRRIRVRWLVVEAATGVIVQRAWLRRPVAPAGHVTVEVLR